MQAALRYVGVLNAAVWLGATVFFTFGAGPAIFSDEAAAFLPRAYRARMAELVIARLIVLQQVCGLVALGLFLAESIRAGRLVRRLALGVVSALFLTSLLAGFWLAPKMHSLQQVRYSARSTPEQQAAAGRSFNLLHGLSQTVNLFVLAGLLFHLAQVTRTPDTPANRWNAFRSQAPTDGTVPRML